MSTRESEHSSFVRDLRAKIEDATCETSGICVYEHDDESALNNDEKAILERLRTAHETWQSSNKLDTKEDVDVYKSVRMRV